MLRRTLIFSALAVGLPLAAAAADHAEAPDTRANPLADIADLYAWHADGELNAVLTFDGLGAAGEPASIDPDVLYGIHIDSDGDLVPDETVWVRFREVRGKAWVIALGLPGEKPVAKARLGEMSEDGSLFAGRRDDPFFFDLTGFQDTLATGDLSFDNTRDSFAGTNVTAIVVRMNASEALPNGTGRIWATTALKEKR